MGRKPNPLILEFFERGQKLNDNSNRYPHRCKLCGEDFPKGRIDSLTTHLTRKCPAISEADRINACLTLNGISSKAAKSSAAANLSQPRRPNKVQQDWSALGILAEASRQVEVNEKHDDHSSGAHQVVSSPAAADPFADSVSGPNTNAETTIAGAVDFQGKGKAVDPADSPQDQFISSDPNEHSQSRFEFQEHVVQDSPAGLNKSTGPEDRRGLISTTSTSEEDLSNAELEKLLRSAVSSSETASISIAAAATARLNPQLLDPQLRATHKEQPDEDMPDSMETHRVVDSARGMSGQALAASFAAASEATAAAVAHEQVNAASVAQEQAMAATIAHEQATAAAVAHQPWGGITYMSEGIRGPPTLDHENMQTPGEQSKGGVRLDSPNGAKARHARARFDATRRKEVQEVRKIGACIRCKILRKTCSQGSPCDTCRKVLSPRVWKTGCIRTKISEQLDIYSAGVQIVLCQNRMNDIKRALHLINNGLRIKISHFNEGSPASFIPMYQSVGLKKEDVQLLGAEAAEWTRGNLIMIDMDADDLGAKMDTYAQEAMKNFVQNEPSHFVRCTLETTMELVDKTPDELLSKALALWSFVEIMDRERSWIIHVVRQPGSAGSETVGQETITNNNNFILYTTVCLQIAAAAERKAAAASKSLLTTMQRMLLDSKTKIGHSIYFATLILLHCIEKTTWAFNVWEKTPLGADWPLERQPGDFYSQGYNIADHMRQLMSIRKALPIIAAGEEDGVLFAKTENDAVKDYFTKLNLNYTEVEHKMNNAEFDAANPRSFELLFCSRLLLPEQP